MICQILASSPSSIFLNTNIGISELQKLYFYIYGAVYTFIPPLRSLLHSKPLFPDHLHHLIHILYTQLITLRLNHHTNHLLWTSRRRAHIRWHPSPH